MYEDLIKELRYLEKIYSICGNTSTKEYKLAVDAADAIEELQGKTHILEKLADYWCNKVPKWIPVTERLPDESEPVLAFIRWSDYEDNEICYGQYIKNGRFRLMHYVEGELIKGYEVEAWMPLPEPPKEE